jgi:hypothetical protein
MRDLTIEPRQQSVTCHPTRQKKVLASQMIVWLAALAIPLAF